MKFEAVQRPPTIHELTQKILLLSMMITEETKHDVFCEYSGHVQKFCIRIYLTGWFRDCKPDFQYEAWLKNDEEKFNKMILGEILDTLERIYKEGTQCQNSPAPVAAWQ